MTTHPMDAALCSWRLPLKQAYTYIDTQIVLLHHSSSVVGIVGIEGIFVRIGILSIIRKRRSKSRVSDFLCHLANCKKHREHL